MDDAEVQMRRALGLQGDSNRSRPEPERSESAPRPGGQFMQAGGHRRRFVQDGDIPVTIVRREHSGDMLARPAAATPSSNRLQRTEAALAAETATRERAERSLAEAQAMLRDLQTKLGHAALAKDEAAAALRREREEFASMRDAAAEQTARVHEAESRAEAAEVALGKIEDELQSERGARKVAERALKQAIADKEAAERLLLDLSSAPDPEPAPVVPARRMQPVQAAPRRTKVAKVFVPEPETEPEPVKWWLPKQEKARRR